MVRQLMIDSLPLGFLSLRRFHCVFIPSITLLERSKATNESHKMYDDGIGVSFDYVSNVYNHIFPHKTYTLNHALPFLIHSTHTPEPIHALNIPNNGPFT